MKIVKIRAWLLAAPLVLAPAVAMAQMPPDCPIPPPGGFVAPAAPPPSFGGGGFGGPPPGGGPGVAASIAAEQARLAELARQAEDGRNSADEAAAPPPPALPPRTADEARQQYESRLAGIQADIDRQVERQQELSAAASGGSKIDPKLAQELAAIDKKIKELGQEARQVQRDGPARPVSADSPAGAAAGMLDHKRQIDELLGQ